MPTGRTNAVAVFETMIGWMDDNSPALESQAHVGLREVGTLEEQGPVARLRERIANDLRRAYRSASGSWSG